ncbi:MAG: ComF family protein [Clostridia bacterium]|nr:ComF family protein [Clostridia bacterium]
MNLGKLIKENLFPLGFTCDACGIETFGSNLCPDCLKKTTFNDKCCCPICGRKTVRYEICIECKAKPPLFEIAVSPLIYEGTAVKLIYKFKNGDAYLKDYFADLIVKKLADTNAEIDYVTFVPMTKKAERKRGYNQARLLAESISERLNIPLVSVIEKIKDTSEQKSLSGKERAKNLAGSFKAQSGRPLLDKNVLLVDDILTTGATADAVCYKLFTTGVTKVFLATVASVEYKPLTKENKKQPEV